MAELVTISRQYPKEKIWVEIQDGGVVVGFVKGDYGDKQHAAWLAVTPFLEMR